jgi:hypothetical protein
VDREREKGDEVAAIMHCPKQKKRGARKKYNWRVRWVGESPDLFTRQRDGDLFGIDKRYRLRAEANPRTWVEIEIPIIRLRFNSATGTYTVWFKGSDKTPTSGYTADDLSNVSKEWLEECNADPNPTKKHTGLRANSCPKTLPVDKSSPVRVQAPASEKHCALFAIHNAVGLPNEVFEKLRLCADTSSLEQMVSLVSESVSWLSFRTVLSQTMTISSCIWQVHLACSYSKLAATRLPTMHQRNWFLIVTIALQRLGSVCLLPLCNILALFPTKSPHCKCYSVVVTSGPKKKRQRKKRRGGQGSVGGQPKRTKYS